MLAPVPVFEETLETIFTKTDFPPMMRTFLLAQVPPVTTIDVFASCVSSADTIQATLSDPAGFGDLPAGQKLSVRGRVAAAWSLARKRFDEDNAPEKKDPHSDATISSEKRLQVVSNFQQRYGHAIPPEDLPSERTMGLVYNAWRKRTAEPIPFSVVLSVKDGDTGAAGYLPIIPGITLAIQQTNVKKNHHWMHSIPHYIQTVEILMLAYAMASTLDEPGSEWLHYDVARLYVSRLRKMERLNALSDPNIWHTIAECETSMRSERHDRNLTDPALSLTDLVSLSLEHDRFPDASKSIPARTQRDRRNQQMTPRESYPKYAQQEPYAKRQKKEDRDRTTRGPKGNPFMEKDFCHKNQRNQCTHGLACKYAHDSTEMTTIQACYDSSIWVSAADLRCGRAQKKLDDARTAGGSNRQN